MSFDTVKCDGIERIPLGSQLTIEPTQCGERFLEFEGLRITARTTAAANDSAPGRMFVCAKIRREAGDRELFWDEGESCTITTELDGSMRIFLKRNGSVGKTFTLDQHQWGVVSVANGPLEEPQDANEDRPA